MVKSMTGYGRGFMSLDGREITVEIKSVNHRYLDVSMRLPRHIVFLEEVFRKQLNETLSRGHVDVFVHYHNRRSDARTIVVDETLMAQYLHAVDEIVGRFPLENDMTVSKLMRMPDVIDVTEAEEDRSAVTQLAQAAMQTAIESLIVMRETEGKKLNADLQSRMQAIRALREEIKKRAPGVAAEYRNRLNERIAQILEEHEMDRARLATEVALFVDRANIDEEITRLESHFSQVSKALTGDDPAGRKLEFIVQEINREFNTIGSKANDSDLTNYVLDAKSEIEKIREQVQNIE